MAGLRPSLPSPNTVTTNSSPPLPARPAAPPKEKNRKGQRQARPSKMSRETWAARAHTRTQGTHSYVKYEPSFFSRVHVRFTLLPAHSHKMSTKKVEGGRRHVRPGLLEHMGEGGKVLFPPLRHRAQNLFVPLRRRNLECFFRVMTTPADGRKPD